MDRARRELAQAAARAEPASRCSMPRRSARARRFPSDPQARRDQERTAPMAETAGAPPSAALRSTPPRAEQAEPDQAPGTFRSALSRAELAAFRPTAP